MVWYLHVHVTYIRPLTNTQNTKHSSDSYFFIFSGVNHYQIIWGRSLLTKTIRKLM